ELQPLAKRQVALVNIGVEQSNQLDPFAGMVQPARDLKGNQAAERMPSQRVRAGWLELSNFPDVVIRHVFDAAVWALLSVEPDRLQGVDWPCGAQPIGQPLQIQDVAVDAVDDKKRISGAVRLDRDQAGGSRTDLHANHRCK